MPSARAVPSVLELLTARQLAWMRQWAGLGVAEAADRVGRNPTTIRRWELGERGIKHRDAEALMCAYGVTAADRRRFLTDLDSATRPGWWDAYREVIEPWHAAYLAAEYAAAVIRVYEPVTVPALLQTADCARAMLHAAAPGLRPAEAARRLEARAAGRDAVLRRREPSTLWAVVHETALTTLATAPDLARAQIDHLLTLTEQAPHVTVQIVPAAHGPYPGMQLGPVALLRYGATSWPDTVYLPGLTDYVRLESAAAVERHLSTLDAMCARIPPATRTPQELLRIRANL